MNAIPNFAGFMMQTLGLTFVNDIFIASLPMELKI